MREAVGGSMLLYLVVIFTSIVILFFVGIISYSKVYKVKNRIIEIIEREEKYETNLQTEIDEELKRIGYRTTSVSGDMCQNHSNRGTCSNLNTSGYGFCVCEHVEGNGKTYEVITYVHFDFPVLGDVISFPVHGETKVLGRVYDY